MGCPKNQVDTDKLVGTLLADGMTPTDDAALADLVVVNTCAFIDEARKESIDTILALEDQRKDGARLVVTGCMAERYGDELAAALPEVDQVAGFGVPVNLGRKPLALSVSDAPIPMLDLLNLPRPKSASPWAYVKIAEGCDRTLRVLRDPVVPRSAAQPRRRRRSSPRSSSSRRGRSCWSPRISPATARTVPTSSAPARSCRW